MKKIISILVVTVLLAAVFAVSAFADDSANITVTISDGNGNIAVAREAITVTDADSDGTITVNDAFIAAHDAWYEGGAAAGYESETTEWGLSVKKLWGVENGGSYGYYVNDAMAMGLTDPIADGDYLAAFVYVDAQGLSDVYSYIELSDAQPDVQGYYYLEAKYSGWDQNWNPVVMPIVGASVYVDGVKTTSVTDNIGMFGVLFEENGDHIITVRSDERNYACAVYILSEWSLPEVTTTDAPVSETLTTDAPITDAPVTDARVTDAPVTNAPVIDAPTAEVTGTDVVPVETPVTDAPTVEITGTDVVPVETPVEHAAQTGDAMIVVIALLAFSAIVFTAVKRREEK